MNRARHILGRLIPEPFLVLLPLATVTTLFAANMGEGLRLSDLQDSLTVAFCLAGLAWAATLPWTVDRLSRSLAAVSVSIPPLLSGYLFGWVRDSGLEGQVKAGTEVLLVIAFVFGALLAVRRWGGSPEAGRFLNVFSALTVILAVPAAIESSGELNLQFDGTTVLPDTADLYRPNIYLIVLDAYSGSASLRDVYGYDNSAFISSLRGRGFSIPPTSRSNYTKTFLSLGSTLNRQYFESLISPVGGEIAGGRDTYNMRMEFNRTAIDLKRLGYRFYYVGSSYPPLSTNRLADAQFAERGSKYFSRLYLSTTVLQPVAELCFSVGMCRGAEAPFQAETARETMERINHLSSLVDLPGPKFVYAHWLLPHGPYRFDANCNPRTPRWTIGKRPIEDESLLRQRYVDQVRCTNSLLLTFVDRVGRHSGGQALVLLQSDHGNGRFPGEMPPVLSAAGEDQVQERFDVFAAYSGPGGIGDSLAANRTPVNLFRTVFRVLWDVPEEPLPDRFFWSQGSEPLQLIEMEEDLTPAVPK